MNYFVLSVLVLFGTINDSLAQTISSSNNKNTLELFYVISHFFDGTYTNWFLLAPIHSNYVRDNNNQIIDYDVEYVLPPLTLGIQYTRKYNDRNSARISAMSYLFGYNMDNIERGEVIRRQYGLYSIGWIHKLLGNDKKTINFIGELNYRNGTESIYIYQPRRFEIRVESLTLKDVGLSTGLKIEQIVPFNFVISIEAIYSRFIYRYSKGVDFFGQHKNSTPNTFTLKLGLGYQF